MFPCPLHFLQAPKGLNGDKTERSSQISSSEYLHCRQPFFEDAFISINFSPSVIPTRVKLPSRFFSRILSIFSSAKLALTRNRSHQGSSLLIGPSLVW